MKKRLLKIKWENLLLLAFIPLAIIQFNKANIDLKLVSVCMSLILYGGFYIVVQMSRKEALLKVKYTQEKPVFTTLLNMINAYLSTKKRDYLNKQYINDQAYILRASIK